MCDAKTPARETAEAQGMVGRPVEVRRIPPGTRIQIGGRTFMTVEPVVVEGHPDNFARAAVDVVFPQPGLSGDLDEGNRPRPLSAGGRSRY